jgi:hypothetical protein
LPTSPAPPHGCSTRSSKAPTATAEALKFFAHTPKGTRWWTKLDYVPMPNNVVGDIEKMWSAEIKDATGKSLFVASKQRQ